MLIIFAVRYFFIHARMAIIKKIENTIGEDVEKLETSYVPGFIVTIWKTVCQFL